MFRTIINTDSNLAPLILRITMGGVVFAHGLQKMFGLFGGHGLVATMDSFHAWWGIPHVLTFLVVCSDSIGAILVILRFLTRVWAGAIGLVMLGAIYFAHGQWGFYMIWKG